MSTLSSLVHELTKELKNEKAKITYLGRTKVEAKELLKKLEAGEFKQILDAKNEKVKLTKLSRFDLYRSSIKKTTIPTLKEYRIFCIIEDLNKKLEELDMKKISPSNLKKTKKKIEKFLTNLKNGVYDDLLIQENFWFWFFPETDVLLKWDSVRSNNYNLNELTLPNYIVFSVYCEIMKHIKRINGWKETFGSYYRTQFTDKKQTPTTKEELEIYKKIASELTRLNYDWREARNVVRKFYKLDIYEDYTFPHNIDKIKKIFIPKKKIVFPKFETAGECSYNITEVQARAEDLIELMTSNNIINIFLNKDRDKIDEYLRDMIFSQFDFERISKKISNRVRKEKLKDIFKNTDNYIETEVRELFRSFPKKTKDELYDLAYGVLSSLTEYQQGDKIKIYNDAIKMQDNLNCWEGIVSSNIINSVTISTGEIIYSLPSSDIKKEFYNFQQEYNYYNANSSSDFEYIEGCIEIIGNVMLSQIFLSGNKRTSKCLFNAMLVAKGITPPVLNFCEDELWEGFVLSRHNKYIKAKRMILEDCIKLNDYFNNPDYKSSVYKKTK